MIVWKTIRRYWYLPTLTVLSVVTWILWRRWVGKSSHPMDLVSHELKAIQAGVEVEKLTAELGHQEALKHIDDKYAEEMRRMDEAQRKKSDKLRKDPEALTRYIVRGS